jgi:diguanylate cyclase (GGDEF)-like protein
MTPLRLFDSQTEPFSDLLLLEDAPAESVVGALSRSRVICAAPGETVLAAGAFNDKVYVVLRGTLRVDLDGRGEGSARHLGRGECIGELSVIDGSRASVPVLAVDRCELLALEGDDVLALAEASHAVARNLLRILSRRLRGTNELLRKEASESESLRMRSVVDVLTGLYTRAWLDETLERMAQRSDGGDPQFSLIMADVDHFKEFNDTWGHVVGDRVLQKVGAILRTVLRPSDAATRYGGEEFVIVLPGIAAPERAAHVAERIRDAAHATVLMPEMGAASPRLTISLGVAVRQPRETARELLRRADEAMYRAKRTGRDRVVAF